MANSKPKSTPIHDRLSDFGPANLRPIQVPDDVKQ